MLAIDLKNENGDPLSIPGEVTISVTSEQIGNMTTENGISNMKFWQLNHFTGSWEYVADVIKSEQKTRKRRQITGDTFGQNVFTTKIRGISVETVWYNLDIKVDMGCFSKIRVFQSSGFIEEDQISGARVGIIVEDVSNNLRSLSTFRARSDSTEEKTAGYCISHPCITGSIETVGNQFKASYFVDFNGKEMKPATVNIGISDSLKSKLGYEIRDNIIEVDDVVVDDDDNGPYYYRDSWDSSNKCSSATFTENHFRFYDDSSCFKSYTTLETPIGDGKCEPDNYLLWHSPTTQRFSLIYKYRVCFVKVGLESVSPLPMKIRVTSKEKVPRKDNNRNIFGTRDGCNENFTKAVCLEFKDPSRIGCSIEEPHDITNSSITIVIEGINTERYQMSDISFRLYKDHNKEIYSTSNSISIGISAGSNYGSDYGIYCSLNPDKSVAYVAAAEECKYAGDTDGGWAVKFTGMIT